MKKSGIISAIVITAGLFSASASAQQNPLEQLTTHLVNQAVQMTSLDLNQSVKQVVANTAYRFELKGERPAGKVQVTDLAAAEPAKESKKGEKALTE